MRIKKVPMNNYYANLYKTSRYTTMHIELLFELNYTKENIYLCDLLSEYMLSTNKKYKTKEELSKKYKTFYSMNFSINVFNIGEKMFFVAKFTYYDPKKVQDDYLIEALRFSHDLLFELNNFDNKLDKETLEKCKINMITELADAYCNPSYKAKIDYLNTIFPGTYMTIDILKDKEEYENLLNSFTDQKIINIYNTLINESFVGMTLMGNFNDAYLNEIKNQFKFKNIKELDNKYTNKLKINDKDKYVLHIDKEANESILNIAFEYKKYNKKFRYIYIAIEMILNYDSGRLLHKTLRDERHLVYNAYSLINNRAGGLSLTASIRNSNEKKCIKAFRDVLNMLKDEKFADEMLVKVRKTIEAADFIADENKWNVFNELLNIQYKWKDSRKKRKNYMFSLTGKDIVDGINNLEEKVIYFYKGEANEK